jgi:hypothetical protein
LGCFFTPVSWMTRCFAESISNKAATMTAKPWVNRRLWLPFFLIISGGLHSKQVVRRLDQLSRYAQNILLAWLVVGLALAGCTTSHVLPSTTPEEIQVQIIPLSGPIARPTAEISGLAWYGDQLVLLPQFPERFEHHLFRLDRTDLVAYIVGDRTEPLTPLPIQIENADLRLSLKGFEGFEAITFYKEQVFLTIEAKPKGMVSYLVKGTISNEAENIVLDDTLIEINPQAEITNYSDESILVYQEEVYTFYEANGKNVNPAPVVHVFSLQGTALDPVPFPNIEYRITDVSEPDMDGKFWAINYLFPPDTIKISPAEDHLALKYGRGPTHLQNQAVERLVAFQITDQDVELVETAPIQLSLAADMVSRNWEGLAILENYGFLIVTDKFPQTLLGFVPWDFADR